MKVERYTKYPDYAENANDKVHFDCFMDKLVSIVNDNVNIVYLMTTLIYVTLDAVAIFITPVFPSHPAYLL